jgi:hypothetical protein
VSAAGDIPDNSCHNSGEGGEHEGDGNKESELESGGVVTSEMKKIVERSVIVEKVEVKVTAEKAERIVETVRSRTSRRAPTTPTTRPRNSA